MRAIWWPAISRPGRERNDVARYILKRVLIAIPVLIGITLLEYLLMSLAPGTPLDMMRGPRVSEAAIANRAAQLGLDKPAYLQYFYWLKQILSGNLGYSITSHQPVADLVSSHIGPTLLLMGTSMLLGLLIALPVGVYSAVHQNTLRDYTATALSFLGTSIPNFFLSMVLVFLFTVKLRWLPSSGMTTLGAGGGAADVLAHMAMPVVVLATYMAGFNARYIRSSMLEILQQDYLRTAYAKGVKRFFVINKHAMRNALVPIVTIVGMQIPMLFGGAVVVEQIFSWLGLGLLTMTAITSRDYPTIMAVSLLSAVIVLASNLLTDILYVVVDPTIQYR